MALFPGKRLTLDAARQRNPQHFHRACTGSALLCTSHPHLCAQSAGKQPSGRADRQQPINAPAPAVTQPAGRTRDSGPSADEIVQEPGLGRSPPPWVWPSATAASAPAASGRGCVGTSPVLPAVTRVITAGILMVAGVPVLEEDVPAGQNQTRPPMYEMGGLARHRHARSGQLPGFAGATRRPPVPSIRARDPVSRLLPRSRGRPQGGARFQR